MINQRYIVILIVSLLASVSLLFGISAEAGLSSDRVSVGETFQLKVTVNNDEQIKNLPWPKIQGLGPFGVKQNSGYFIKLAYFNR